MEGDEGDATFPSLSCACILEGGSGVDPLVCPWVVPMPLEGERCCVFRFGSGTVSLDGPAVGGPVAITGSPEDESATDACLDPTGSARGGSAWLESERMVRDAIGTLFEEVDSAGAFDPGFALLEIDGGVLE